MGTRAFAFLVVLAMASPADANVIRVAPPWPAGIEGAPRRASPVRSAGVAPTCFEFGRLADCKIDMEYFGGPVIANVKVVAVFWDSTVNAEIQERIGGFYRTLVSSVYLDVLSEYSTTGEVTAGARAGQPGTGQIVGRGSYAGSITLPSLSRAYFNCASDPSRACLKDDDISAELSWQVAHGVLPAPDGNTLFMVHLPASVIVDDPANVGRSCQRFCAYHASAKSGGGRVFYAVLPALDANGCEWACGGGGNFEKTCSAASHEIAEAITDADVGAAFTVAYPLAWYDVASPSQGEVVDMCWAAGTVGPEGRSGCAEGADGCYRVQPIFSRALWDADPGGHPGTAACVTERWSHAGDFTLALPASVDLDAGGSTRITVSTTREAGEPPLPVRLSAGELSHGVHAAFDRDTIQAGEQATLTLSADADAWSRRAAQLVVRGTAASSIRSASVLLNVHGAAFSDFELSIAPESVVIVPGKQATFTVRANLLQGDVEPVTLTPLADLPPGVVATWDAETLFPGTGTAALQVATDPAAAVGRILLRVRGTSPSRPEGREVTAVLDLQTRAPPQVTFASPGAGDIVAGTVTVELDARPGTGSQLASVSVQVDGAVIGSGKTTRVSWDTTQFADGPHTIDATLRDTDGGKATASAEVIVRNEPAPEDPVKNTSRPRPEPSGCSAGGGAGAPGLLLALALLWRGVRGTPQATARRRR